MHNEKRNDIMNLIAQQCEIIDFTEENRERNLEELLEEVYDDVDSLLSYSDITERTWQYKTICVKIAARMVEILEEDWSVEEITPGLGQTQVEQSEYVVPLCEKCEFWNSRKQECDTPSGDCFYARYEGC